MSTLQHQNRLHGWYAEQFLLLPVIAMLSGIWLINYLFAKLTGSNVFNRVQHQSLSGHELVLREFNCGI